MLRTHTCGEPRLEHVDQELTLSGWIDSLRDHGGVQFLNLRDRYGIVQVTLHPEEVEGGEATIARLRHEQSVQVVGTVRARPDGMANKEMPTGDIEIVGKRVEVFGECPPLPFEVSDQSDEANEELRLRHRFLDLRRSTMQRRFRFRSDLLYAIRSHLYGEGFVDLETPLLTRSTPEGARDFLVPSRTNPGKFYALPQSPQIFKQIYMVSGFDRYMQVVKCFRDEDLRADRQPEFTQLDLEMSFVETEDVMQLVEGLVRSVMKELFALDLPELPRMTYDEAMNRYGCDAPDIRFGLELVDVSDIAGAMDFRVFSAAVEGGGAVKGIRKTDRNLG